MTEQEVTPALLAANERLLALRAIAVGLRPRSAGGCPTGGYTTNGRCADAVEPWSHLPAHLGWGSEPLTALARRDTSRRVTPKSGDLAEPIAVNATAVAPEPTVSPVSESVKIYPDIAVACLSNQLAGAGRIWFLLRHSDQRGRGWLTIQAARQQLTSKASPWRLCGERQFRNVLKTGQGVFWEQTAERLWLKSPAKVAIALGLGRLKSWPVELPLHLLLDKLGVVKAHFFASFHSGRRPSPISRQTLSQISTVSPRTQRAYDKTAGQRSQSNLAIGEVFSQEAYQERAWLNGRAVFEFVDRNGRQGPPQRRYIAWHLPNSYEGCHVRSRKGRWRKINRQIGLVQERAQGNNISRLFCPNGAKAARIYNRHSGKQDAYWPESGKITLKQQMRHLSEARQIWHTLSQEKRA